MPETNEVTECTQKEALKLCSVCAQLKPLSEFPGDSRGKLNGCGSRCKKCKSARAREAVRVKRQQVKDRGVSSPEPPTGGPEPLDDKLATMILERSEEQQLWIMKEILLRRRLRRNAE